MNYLRKKAEFEGYESEKRKKNSGLRDSQSDSFETARNSERAKQHPYLKDSTKYENLKFNRRLKEEPTSFILLYKNFFTWVCGM